MLRQSICLPISKRLSSNLSRYATASQQPPVATAKKPADLPSPGQRPEAPNSKAPAALPAAPKPEVVPGAKQDAIRAAEKPIEATPVAPSRPSRSKPTPLASLTSQPQSTTELPRVMPPVRTPAAPETAPATEAIGAEMTRVLLFKAVPAFAAVQATGHGLVYMHQQGKFQEMAYRVGRYLTSFAPAKEMAAPKQE